MLLWNPKSVHCWLEFVSSFESKLSEVFKDMHDYHAQIEGRLKAEQFKVSVLPCSCVRLQVVRMRQEVQRSSAFG